jgi:hypothetical protein
LQGSTILSDILFYGNSVRDWLISVGLAAVVFIGVRLPRGIFVRRLGSIARRTDNVTVDLIVALLGRPVRQRAGSDGIGATTLSAFCIVARVVFFSVVLLIGLENLAGRPRYDPALMTNWGRERT